MRSSPSSSAQQAKQALADRLREIRLDAGLSARALALRAGWHESKCSRIEHARTTPSEADIKLWCEICDAADQAADLIASARAIESMYVEWRRMQRTGLRQLQESFTRRQEAAQHTRVYHSQVIPGFFQTPGYATALLSEIARFHEIPNDVEEAVAARMERHRLLRQGDRRFAVVIEESVLRYQLGDPATMAGQLGHLLDEATLPSVSLGIIPFARSNRPTWTLEGFTILDEALVDVELLSANVVITQPREIALYTKAFGEFAAMAVCGKHARALINDAIGALG
ncbi:MAG: helix-turn-helix domain-containing protein [Micromonosporaceae bacterium]